MLKGSRIFSGNYNIIFNNINLKIGSTQSLAFINLFDNISSIEKYPLSGAKLARAAGSGAKIVSKSIEKSLLKLSSG